MATYTLNKNDPDVLNINSKPAIKAASSDGKAILLAVLDFAKGNAEVGTNLRYASSSLAWLDNKRKIVLFNVADNQNTSAEAVQLIKDFSKLHGFEVPVKTDVAVGGVLTTDRGDPIAVTTPELEASASDENDTSTKKAELIKVDHESNAPKGKDCPADD